MMAIPQWVRTMIGLCMIVVLGYVLWTYKVYIIGACILYACYKGLRR
jgi:hypothetical protein